MAARILGGHLALTERGVCELPVAGAVADRIDVRHGRAAMLVGGDALPLVELHADLLQAEPLDERTASHGDQHQVRLHRLTVTVVDGELRAVVLDLRALLAELQRDAAPPELLRKLLRRVRVLLRDQRLEHLDDRHLGAETAEDRGELAADDAAAEDDEPPRDLLLRQEPGRVDAPRRVEPFDRRAKWKRAGRDDRGLEGDVFSAFDRQRVRIPEGAGALHPVDAVRLEEPGDARRHLLDDARLPRVRRGEVERCASDLHAELREALLGLAQRVRGLHPRLRGDAPDAEARAAELGLHFDTRDLRAELGGADRCGVAAGAAPEDGDVNVHFSSPGSSVQSMLTTPGGRSPRSLPSAA